MFQPNAEKAIALPGNRLRGRAARTAPEDRQEGPVRVGEPAGRAGGLPEPQREHNADKEEPGLAVEHLLPEHGRSQARQQAEEGPAARGAPPAAGRHPHLQGPVEAAHPLRRRLPLIYELSPIQNHQFRYPPQF